MGSIPGQGTKIPQAVWCSQEKKKKKTGLEAQGIYPLNKPSSQQYKMMRGEWRRRGGYLVKEHHPPGRARQRQRAEMYVDTVFGSCFKMVHRR